MSYSRSFTKTIAVHYSGSVNYPASQSSGTVHYSGTAYEDVNVTITVDTDDFDSSVHNCNQTVGVLTGAVVATEGAQVASIKEKADRVGQTIINGFFKTIRSEISQQIMELTNKINAVLLHLTNLSQRCTEKQRQMEKDYHRISERYTKIFEELNQELQNRIYELDKPAFAFRQESDKNINRLLETDMVNTVAVSGTENSHLEAMMSASYVKKNALDCLSKINTFLEGQKRTTDVLHNCMMPYCDSSYYYVPICYVETTDTDNQINHNIYTPQINRQISTNDLMDEFNRMEWSVTDNPDESQIRLHFNNELTEQYPASEDVHENRVRDYIVQLFNLQNTKNI